MMYSKMRILDTSMKLPIGFIKNEKTGGKFSQDVGLAGIEVGLLSA